MLCSMTGLFRPSFLATPWENDRTDTGVGYSFTLVVFIICSTFSSPGLWMNVWPFWKVARGHAVLRRKPALVRDNWKPQVNGKVEGKSFYHDQLYSMTSALVQWIPLRKKNPPKSSHTQCLTQKCNSGYQSYGDCYGTHLCHRKLLLQRKTLSYLHWFENTPCFPVGQILRWGQYQSTWTYKYRCPRSHTDIYTYTHTHTYMFIYVFVYIHLWVKGMPVSSCTLILSLS